jgi:hypothetical protein
MLCVRFSQLCQEQDLQLERPAYRPTWEDWIFAESRRRYEFTSAIFWPNDSLIAPFCRVACLWFLTSRVASIKARIECNSLAGFREMSLPSSKVLWEASSSSLWEFEYELDALEKPSRVSTIGELIAAQQRPNGYTDARLDAWNAGIDELGLLLNLTTAMA